MQNGIHPRYEPVVFRDTSTGHMFLSRSTRIPEATVQFEGTTYPVVDVEISSDSHPFWTGTARTLDTEGRVERFRRRYAAASGAQGGAR
ncbi:50S ribosomal protein L31 [Serinicoccus chungangensis]|uniref:50S ribosomal protein L31 n=1 Tax=Serinicoccus chungangensis TaxID=767452 RepID=A0A0W8I0C4_9MICO|nr:type B 50S ribosomal protein L31 [Serinicoccus chungangensis]KUG51063.1 50S ribosomal protein L31 [Serinicoccus chungangensis]